MTQQTDFLNTQSEPIQTSEVLYIVKRPMYRVLVLVNGLDVDVQIVLTAKGRQYARGRAHGFHRRIESEEDALAEILAARDNWQPTRTERRPDATFERRHFANA